MCRVVSVVIVQAKGLRDLAIWTKSVGAEAPPTKNLAAEVPSTKDLAARGDLGDAWVKRLRYREVFCGRGFSPDGRGEASARSSTAIGTRQSTCRLRQEHRKI
ncbi:DUF6053 domain-containing protein [Lysobacter capsici]|uniref:DUF6053 domain-containing protein n=1 Tax=Lysobacter capsici TaxID=435897 RepID=UPI003D2F63CB